MSRRTLARAALTVTALLLVAGGGLAWYFRFLDRLPAEFERPLDAEKTRGLGQRTLVGGWGGSGGGVTRTPVIFLHGTTGAAWTFGVARLLFRRWGYTPDDLWALTYGWGGARHVDANGVETTDDSVDANLDDLDAFVHEVLRYVRRRNPSVTQVDLVGHSMGGVLARKWLRQGDNAKLVRRLVTLDSPNHGIQAQWLRETRSSTGWTRFNQDFALGSPWLAELNAPPEVPPGVRALAVYDGTGEVSFTATPLSPRLEGADNLPYNLDRGTRLSHTAYVYDSGVLAAVFDWLQEN